MELSLPHIRRDDDRSRTPTAHKYWCAYFWHKISTGEEIGAGFGYDLRSWEEDSSNPNIPPWRVYIYLHQPAPHHFKVIQDIRIVCEANGWLDKYATDLPTDKSNPDTSLWLPVPKEFIRGLNEAKAEAPLPILLAGAVNAFLGNLIP